ncbi:TPA: hypothetical protein ACXDAY_002089 [Clostridium botulinum]|uniref:hypothetical protein n=1 Tax=Clostridium botulinum TaxID=1491 RepID=UPI0004B556E6|nr:hypothetical protein [Clostridium botulinum]APR02396.1 hypothetical protein RSJ2_4100 [Clostridium botulinum]
MNVKRWNDNKNKLKEKKTSQNYTVANTKDVILSIKKCNRKYAKALKKLADS